MDVILHEKFQSVVCIPQGNHLSHRPFVQWKTFFFENINLSQTLDIILGCILGTKLSGTLLCVINITLTN